MEKSNKYKTLKVMNKPLFVWGMNPAQLFFGFFIFALCSLSFGAHGALSIIGMMLFARWSKNEIKKGNYNPISSLIVKSRTPRVIIDTGNYYENL